MYILTIINENQLILNIFIHNCNNVCTIMKQTINRIECRCLKTSNTYCLKSKTP